MNLCNSINHLCHLSNIKLHIELGDGGEEPAKKEEDDFFSTGNFEVKEVCMTFWIALSLMDNLIDISFLSIGYFNPENKVSPRRNVKFRYTFPLP